MHESDKLHLPDFCSIEEDVGLTPGHLELARAISGVVAPQHDIHENLLGYSLFHLHHGYILSTGIHCSQYKGSQLLGVLVLSKKAGHQNQVQLRDLILMELGEKEPLSRSPHVIIGLLPSVLDVESDIASTLALLQKLLYLGPGVL